LAEFAFLVGGKPRFFLGGGTEFGHGAGDEFGHVELGHRLGHFHFGAHGEAGHFFGHVARGHEAFDEVGDVFGFDAGAAGDAAAAGAVDEVGVFALAAIHGLDDGFGFVEFFLGDFDVLKGGADAGEEAHDLFERSHLADAAHLIEEVIEGEGGVGHLGFELGGFDLIEFGLGLFDEGEDVAHAEHALGDALGVELFEGVEFFADANEFDGLAGDGFDGEGGAAAGVGVELGEDDAVEFELFVEGFGGVDGVLADHGIDDEEDLMGLDLDVDGFEFVHQRLIDVEAAGGVEDDDVPAILLGELDGVAADLDGIFVFALGVDGGVGLLAEGVELVDGGGALQVGGDEEGVFAFGFEVKGELADGGGFSGTLEAAEHEDGGAGGNVEDARGGGDGVAVFIKLDIVAHEADELVVDDFDHLLAGLDGGEDFGTDGFLGDVGDKGVDDVVVDVGFEEGGADFLHGFADIGFGDFAFAGKVAEEGSEAVLKGFKHGRSRFLP
jgi:hypothetical protein